MQTFAKIRFGLWLPSGVHLEVAINVWRISALHRRSVGVPLYNKHRRSLTP